MTSPRRLIACCDGTWNRPDSYGGTTNVVRLLRAIRPLGRHDLSHPESENNPCNVSQITYYHPGVGTGNFVDRLMGGGTGIGLGEHVRTIYAFFVDNFQPGDEIFLFGFSRGAYTARSVAGMLGHLGLLRKSEMTNLDEAWDYYRQPKEWRADEQQLFLANFDDRPDYLKGGNVAIKCIGVWDTVGALGIPNTHVCQQQYQFYDTELGPAVEHAYHALALDEARKNFEPAIWSKSPSAANQKLEQVWFPGVHSNIGGGYPEHGLSDAALFWMCSKVDRLLDLDEDQLCEQAERGPTYAKGKLVDSRKGLLWRFLGTCDRKKISGEHHCTGIHESVWLRTDDKSGLPDPAPYGDATFGTFLTHNSSRRVPLSAYESELLDRIAKTAGKQPLKRNHRNDYSCCEDIVGMLGGYSDRRPVARSDRVLWWVSTIGLTASLAGSWLVGSSNWLGRLLGLPAIDGDLWSLGLVAVLALLAVPPLVLRGIWSRRDIPVVTAMIVGGFVGVLLALLYSGSSNVQAALYGLSIIAVVGMVLPALRCLADASDRGPLAWQVKGLINFLALLAFVLNNLMQTGAVSAHQLLLSIMSFAPVVVAVIFYRLVLRRDSKWRRLRAR
jgi:hypothetical protein